jgi:hypothetical protein
MERAKSGEAVAHPRELSQALGAWLAHYEERPGHRWSPACSGCRGFARRIREMTSYGETPDVKNRDA